MEKQVINYETMLKVANAISHSKDPEEVALMTVESIKTALNVKGCSLFLFNRKTNELELATSFGLSDEYINKRLRKKESPPYSRCQSLSGAI